MLERYLSTDVLVIGGGMAGCQAAIAAAESGVSTMLVEKASVASSGSSPFCHAVLGAPAENEYESWLNELVEGTDYLSEPEWGEKILREQGQHLNRMMEWGVSFEKDNSGNMKQEKGRGQTASWAALFDGRKAMQVIRRVVKARGVAMVERVMLTDLVTVGLGDARVCGAVGIDTRTGQPVIIKAGAVVITTGSTSAKLKCLYSDNVTGDGLGMAWRAGVELINMEFLPKPHFSIWDRRFCTGAQSQFQSHGAIIINAKGERVVDKYTSLGKERMSDLSFLVQIISKEIVEGNGPIYFDMRGWSQEQIDKMRQVQPHVMRAFDQAGIDLQQQPVETTPLLCNWTGAGGIFVDLDGSSSLPGLFAAGNATYRPVNATVLGIAQAFCNVVGYSAGCSAANYARSTGPVPLPQKQVEELKRTALAPLDSKREGRISADDLYLELNRLIVPLPNSIFKSEARIKNVLNELARINQTLVPSVYADDAHELVKANEARNFAQIAEIVYHCAGERRESRKCHYRDDYPYRDDMEWNKYIAVRDAGKGHEIRFIDSKRTNISKGRVPVMLSPPQ